METIFRMLYESAPDSMIVTDREGLVLDVNAQTEIMFHYGRSELIGRRIEVLLPDQLHPPHDDPGQEYFRNPLVRSLGGAPDLRARRKEGSEFPVDIWLGPFETPTGTFALALVWDATGGSKASTTSPISS